MTYKQGFHISPYKGLLNDPNGLCFFNDKYHIFYQWNPNEAKHGIKYWYHLESSNLINWEDKGVALDPTDYFNKNGVYSGTALVEENEVVLSYTGNVKDSNNNRIPYQCLAKMDRYNNITKNYTPIIKGSPKGYTEHFRDPKIWKKNDNYFMIIGAQNEDLEGCIFLYNSLDLVNWSPTKELNINVKGYMYECPDYIELGEKSFILFCPQGYTNDEDVSGYVLVDKDLNQSSAFKILDYGFDYYAAQTFYDFKENRLILIAWMGKPYRSYYDCVEGWTGSLTIPREITYSEEENVILQKPIKELELLRCHKYKSSITSNEKVIEIENLNIEMNELILDNIDYVKDYQIEIINVVDNIENKIVSYDSINKELTIDISNTFYTNSKTLSKSVNLEEELKNMRLYFDRSSIELFINNGKYTMSSRLFLKSSKIIVKIINEQEGKLNLDYTSYELQDSMKDVYKNI